MEYRDETFRQLQTGELAIKLEHDDSWKLLNELLKGESDRAKLVLENIDATKTQDIMFYQMVAKAYKSVNHLIAMCKNSGERAFELAKEEGWLEELAGTNP